MKAKNYRGGYKLVDLRGEDIASVQSISGLYKSLSSAIAKPILLTGIVIDSVAKKDVFVTAEETSDGIKISPVYGYEILVSDEDAITVTEISGGGSKLYKHTITVTGTGGTIVYMRFRIISNSSEEITESTSFQGNSVLSVPANSVIFGCAELVEGFYGSGMNYYLIGSLSVTDTNKDKLAITIRQVDFGESEQYVGNILSSALGTISSIIDTVEEL